MLLRHYSGILRCLARTVCLNRIHSEATVIFLSPPYILQDSQFTKLLTPTTTQISLQKRGIIVSTPLT